MESARKNERGLTLLETLVALSIIFIVFLGLMETGLLSLEYNINNAVRDEGVSVAEMAMETARSMPFDNIAVLTGTTIISRQIRGLSIDYRWTPAVTMLNADTLQLAVNVTWQRNAWTPSGRVLRNYNHQVATLVRRR